MSWFSSNEAEELADSIGSLEGIHKERFLNNFKNWIKIIEDIQDFDLAYIEANLLKMLHYINQDKSKIEPEYLGEYLGMYLGLFEFKGRQVLELNAANLVKIFELLHDRYHRSASVIIKSPIRKWVVKMAENLDDLNNDERKNLNILESIVN